MVSPTNYLIGKTAKLIDYQTFLQFELSLGKGIQNWASGHWLEGFFFNLVT